MPEHLRLSPTNRRLSPLARQRARVLAIGALIAVASGAGCVADNKREPQDVGPTLVDLEARIVRSRELFEAGVRAGLAGEDEVAMTMYRQSVQTYQGWGPSWHNLGVMHIKRGERLEAVQALLRATELMPTDPHPLHNLGILYEEFDPRRAKARYTEALGRNEMFLPSLRRLIVLEQRYHWWDEESDRYIRTALLLERDPDWRARFMRAQTLVHIASNDGRSEADVSP